MKRSEQRLRWRKLMAIARIVIILILFIAYVVDNWDSVEKGAKAGWAAARTK